MGLQFRWMEYYDVNQRSNRWGWFDRARYTSTNQE